MGIPDADGSGNVAGMTWGESVSIFLKFGLIELTIGDLATVEMVLDGQFMLLISTILRPNTMSNNGKPIAMAMRLRRLLRCGKTLRLQVRARNKLTIDRFWMIIVNMHRWQRLMIFRG